MPVDPTVSVIVPTRNRAALLVRTLAALEAQSVPPGEIIVVDNRSTDDTEERVRERAAASAIPIRYVRSDVDRGPARSRNLGAARARGEVLAFVDSDVRPRSDWLEVSLDVLEREADVGMVAGKVVLAHPVGRLQGFGGALGFLGLAWDADEGEEPSAIRAAKSVLWAPAAAVVVRGCAFEEVGGFDDSFFFGYEDSDLGWRLNLAGWRVLCVPESHAEHEAGTRVDDRVEKTSPDMVFHYCKNRLRSLTRNYGPLRLAAVLPLYALFSAADLALRPPRGAKVRALMWNLRNLLETLRLRERTQRGRRRSDRALAPLFSRRAFPPERLAARLGRRRAQAPPPSPGGASEDRVDEGRQHGGLGEDEHGAHQDQHHQDRHQPPLLALAEEEPQLPHDSDSPVHFNDAP